LFNKLYKDFACARVAGHCICMKQKALC